MFGTGLPEFIIILLLILLLFGPAVLTFWLGYVVGQSKAADTRSAAGDDDELVADGEEESTDG